MTKYLRETETLDSNGEYTKVTKTFASKSDEPPFIKLYIDHMLSFKNLSKTLNPILIEFLKYMSYADEKDGQIIYINSAIKRDISKTIKKSVERLNQAITDFVKNDIFKRLDIGKYQVNPFLFGKGDWKDIKNIRATFNYAENKIEKVEVETLDEEKPKPKRQPDLIKDQIPLIDEKEKPPTEQRHKCELCGKELILNQKGDKYYCPTWTEKNQKGERKCKGTFVNVAIEKAS